MLAYIGIIFVFIMPSAQRYSLLYNFSSLGIIQVSSFLLSLIVIPYVLRIVGADGFGVIAVAQVLMFYLSVITDYGFNRTAIRDIAIYKNDKTKTSKIFFTVLASKFLICILCFVVLLVLIWIVPLFRENFILYLLAFSFVIGQVALVNWFFQGVEKMQYMALASLFSRVLFVALVLLFIKEKKDAALYIFFMGAGNFVAGIASIYTVIRMYKLQFIKPSRADIAYELKEGWTVTASNLSMTSIQYIGIFILRLFTNDLIVGYYSIAEKIYFAMKLMLDVFSQVAYPRVCRLILEGIEKVISFFKKVYVPFLGMVVLGCSLIFFLAGPIIYFLVGYQHDQSAFLLRVLCIAAIIACLNIPACLVLLAGDHKKNYLRVFTIGTLINIIVNVTLAPLLQAKGTVLSVIITELIITVGLYREVFRLYHIKDVKGIE